MDTVNVWVSMTVSKEGDAGANISSMLEGTGIKIAPEMYMTPEGAPEGYQYYLFMGEAPEQALYKEFPGIRLERIEESPEEKERRSKASQPDRVFYGEFDIQDHHFHSEYGDKEGVPHWFLTVTRNQEVIRQEAIPMFHRPTFGPDVDDVATLEETADRIIKELGLEDAPSEQ